MLSPPNLLREDTLVYNPFDSLLNDIQQRADNSDPPVLSEYYENDSIIDLSIQQVIRLCQKNEVDIYSVSTENETPDLYSTFNLESDCEQNCNISNKNTIKLKELTVCLKQLDEATILQYVKPKIKQEKKSRKLKNKSGILENKLKQSSVYDTTQLYSKSTHCYNLRSRSKVNYIYELDNICCVDYIRGTKKRRKYKKIKKERKSSEIRQSGKRFFFLITLCFCVSTVCYICMKLKKFTSCFI